MPVRLLSPSVLRWPDKDQVEKALREWAREQKARHPDILRRGYFGSYTRSSWDVGSDLDIVVVVRASDKSFLRRSLDFDTTGLPVPADILVYTEEELQKLEGRFARVLQEEVIWVI
ncbi:nucleotidyltransferase domain-containing protein [Atrimonas thermophila]|uniref:nucleotidyltransferase domain-containing protein n=1 Tax=Atrimonas thermophila TaxID=3064161 RepID=UPI00399D490A